MANPVFDRGMHQVMRAVIGGIGWMDGEVKNADGVRVFEPYRLSATQRCGHFAVQLFPEADPTAPVIPGYETSSEIMKGLTLMWTQKGGQNMGLPWSSIDFVLRSDGKVGLDFEADRAEEEDNCNYVRTVHDAREKLYEELFCETFPQTIVKLNHLFGVWGMGGLVDFKITNPNIGGKGNYHVHSSFGLSNPDMPSWMVAANLKNVKPGTSGKLLSPKEQRPFPRVGMAGYGYELLIITQKQEDWCKYLMQWAVDKEIQSDVNFLAHVEGAGGLTVENVPVGPTQTGNILIAPAQDPWPQSGTLPNGMVKFLIMTVITTEEMKFAMKEGRIALVQRLRKEKIGQFSDLDRLASS